MPVKYLYRLTHKRPPAAIGNKAHNLWRLIDKGFRVPAAWVCSWHAYGQYISGNHAILDSLSAELQGFIIKGQSYAIRSSADIEDSFEHSFAGQFTSQLNVPDLPGVLDAIRAVWDQTRSPEVRGYLQRLSTDRHDIKMAVIIQEMAKPVISGVSFSKNPLTGLNETVIEAVQGSGELLVQDGVTPLRWVCRWGEWAEAPDQAGVDLELIQQVVDQTQQISKTFKQDVDLEWVYDGAQLNWVQMREITTLGDQPVYSNQIAKEMLPGIIKPLVWSVNTPIVNRAWVDLISEVIGENDIDPLSLSKSFYYRAYFNMGTFGRIFERLGMPADSLERMRGMRRGSQKSGKSRGSMMKPGARTLALLPRLLRFAADKWLFARVIDRKLPQLETGFRDIAASTTKPKNTRQLLDDIQQLKELTHQTAYLNIVGPLLMGVFNGALRRQVQSTGVDYESLGLMDGVEQLQLYDPGYHLERLHRQFQQLEPHLQEQVRLSSYAEFCALSGVEHFQQGVARFIDQFGHLSDSGTDFSYRPWREDPDLILQMITAYSPSTGRDQQKIKFAQLPVKGVRRWWIGVFYRRARQFRLYREQISSLYTFGYGLFRGNYLALGEALVRQGRLEQAEDVFYLYEPELDAGDADIDYVALVRQRKLEIEQVRAVELPEVIYGDQPPPVVLEVERVLKGTPTARGYYTGRVKNVRGIQDFPGVQAGDVVVVPYSDVGWTPLFARAGAVIAEAGGILSHCSIVAREYGIPAVVSVSGVIQLKDDSLVTVDGYKGEIILHDKQDESEPSAGGS